MSDDTAPALEQDQPTDQPDAPEVQDQQPNDQEESFTDFDTSQIPGDADREWFEERVQHFQSDYTRKTQEIAEARRELEAERQRLAAQVESDSDEEDEDYLDYEDAEDPNEQRLAQVEAKLHEQDLQDQFAERVEGIEKDEGRELTAKEQRFLWKHVRAELAQNGSSDPTAVWADLKDLYGEDRRQWVASKKAPRKPGSGTPGSRRVDPSKETPEERSERLANVADQARGSLAA